MSSNEINKKLKLPKFITGNITVLVDSDSDEDRVENLVLGENLPNFETTTHLCDNRVHWALSTDRDIYIAIRLQTIDLKGLNSGN